MSKIDKEIKKLLKDINEELEALKNLNTELDNLGKEKDNDERLVGLKRIEKVLNHVEEWQAKEENEINQLLKKLNDIISRKEVDPNTLQNHYQEIIGERNLLNRSKKHISSIEEEIGHVRSYIGLQRRQGSTDEKLENKLEKTLNNIKNELNTLGEYQHKIRNSLEHLEELEKRLDSIDKKA